MAVQVYYVWVTSSNDGYAEALCSKLIRRGFTVGPLARHLITSHGDNPACVVALSLFRSPRNEQEKTEYTVAGIYAEVIDVIKHIKGKFWSLVVSEAAGCTWNIGNTRLSEEQKKLEADNKKVN
jgi:hypothetical protein